MRDINHYFKNLPAQVTDLVTDSKLKSVTNQCPTGSASSDLNPRFISYKVTNLNCNSVTKLCQTGSASSGFGYRVTDFSRDKGAKNTFATFGKEDCEDVIEIHGTSIELWNKFQAFMNEQLANGASLEYYRECFEALEAAWEQAVAMG